MGDEDRPFHNPFAALQSLKDRLPAGPTPAPAPATPPKTAAKPAGKYARAVVRLERAGRGGKDVTIVEHLELPASEREAWLKSLKASLGCGGVIEEGSIVLQGDHRKRLPEILTAKGVRKITVSN